MYHRVAVCPVDPWGLAVEPSAFEQQLDYLTQNRSPMPMQEYVLGLRRRNLPADAVAVTFDDGYRDNLVDALPLLLQYKVPATFFLATGFLDQREPFWWDELASMILACDAPRDNAVDVMGITIPLQWSVPANSEHDARWRAGKPARTDRQKTYLAIWRKLQRAPSEEQKRVMKTLRQHFAPVHDALGMPMSSEEVRTLAAASGASLGAHTVTHPLLTLRSSADRRRELEESRQRCVGLGMVDAGFAYPYGDMNAEVRKDVAAVGFCWACSTETRLIGCEQPQIYALPRLPVSSDSLEAFHTFLRG